MSIDLSIIINNFPKGRELTCTLSGMGSFGKTELVTPVTLLTFTPEKPTSGVLTLIIFDTQHYYQAKTTWTYLEPIFTFVKESFVPDPSPITFEPMIATKLGPDETFNLFLNIV